MRKRAVDLLPFQRVIRSLSRAAGHLRKRKASQLTLGVPNKGVESRTQFRPHPTRVPTSHCVEEVDSISYVKEPTKLKACSILPL